MAGTELATGYVSLVVDTSKVGPQINRAFDSASGAADKAGRQAGSVYGQGVGREFASTGGSSIRNTFDSAATHAERAGGKAGSAFSSGVMASLKGMAGLGAVIGAGLGAKEIITAGNDVTVTLNTMQAQGQLTAEQMAKVQARAKELGNDLTLPGASAASASTAMFELAKAGMSVDDSMKSAKGSLQLAAAAEIDVRTAAELQSSILQTFRLGPEAADHVADVLTNVSSAAQGTAEDVGYALQASATVAAGFGMTMEETATAIGLFAKSGIVGSDAGTLLKTSLLNLVDQGNPAQGAIEELGIKVYDANGEFIDMRSLIDQLNIASATMTEEQYQAATATLFGSDATRLAMIAAEQGAPAFDSMAISVNKQGTAADMAAAKNRGLPGAMEKIENSAQNLGLQLYDLIDGPLADLGTSAAGFLTGVADPLVGSMSAIGSAVVAIPGPVLGLVAAFVALKATGIGDFLSRTSKSMGGFFDNVGQTKTRLTPAIADIAAMQKTITDGRQRLADFETRLQQLPDSDPKKAQMAAGMASMRESFRETERELRQLNAMSSTPFIAMSNAMDNTVAAAGRVRSGVRSIIDSLGGGLGIGIAAATIAIGANIQSAQSASSAQDKLRDSVVQGAKAQTAFSESVAIANGQLSDQALGAASKLVENRLSETITLGERGHTSMESFAHTIDNLTGNIGGQTSAWEDNYDKVSGAVERNDALKKVMADMKIELSDVGQIIAKGGQNYDELIQRLNDSGTAGEDLAKQLTGVKTEITGLVDGAKNATPGFFTLRDAIKVLGDESKTAEEKVGALQTALDIMSGKPIEASAAMAQYNAVIIRTSEATATLWDASKGWGEALVNQDGSVKTNTENGQKLFSSITDIKNATLTAAVAGNDLEAINHTNELQFQKLATATGLSVEQIRHMAEEQGLIPRNIEMLVQLSGVEGTEAAMLAIKTLAQTTGEPVRIPVNAETQETIDRLREVGINVDTATEPGTAIIDANTDEFNRKIDLAIARSIPPKEVPVIANTDKFDAAMRNLLLPTTKTITIQPGPALYPGGIPGVSGLAPRKEGGALYGGIPGRDSIPILGMQGEHMLDKGDVEAMGGQKAVYDFRRSLHMAEGGAVGSYTDSNGDQLTPLQAAMWELIKKQFPSATLNDGPRPGAPDWHGAGKAIDIGGPDMAAMNHWIGTTFPNSLELFYDPGINIDEGKPTSPIGGHSDHIHWAMSSAPTASASLYVLGPEGGAAQFAQPVPDIRSDQQKIEDAIILEGKRRRLPDRAIQIALMAAWTETGMRNLNYGDRDSLGVFQQRDSWGSREERMDPTIAAGKFYDALAKVDYEKLAMHEAAQAVQQSAFADGSNYKVEETRARESLSDHTSRAREGGGLSPSGPSPEAPGQGAMADDQIALERARLAVEEARVARNDIYANAAATDAERKKADLDLSSAQNSYQDALTKLEEADDATETKEDTSGTYTTAEARLKKLGGELAGVAVDAALEQLPFGIGQSRWWTTPIIPEEKDDTQSKKATVTNKGDTWLADNTEILPDWLKKLITGANVGVADSGGWLEPGDMAINLSRKPEPIFSSPGQLAEFAGAAFPANGGAPGLTIEKVVGYSPQEVSREVMKQFRLQQMRYTGRGLVGS